MTRTYRCVTEKSPNDCCSSISLPPLRPMKLLGVFLMNDNTKSELVIDFLTAIGELKIVFATDINCFFSTTPAK